MRLWTEKFAVIYLCKIYFVLCLVNIDFVREQVYNV